MKWIKIASQGSTVQVNIEGIVNITIIQVVPLNETMYVPSYYSN